MASVAAMLAPYLIEDRILPMQWADGGHAKLDLIPEVRLHQAVLLDAIWTLVHYRRAKMDGLRPLPIREVVEWLCDPDGERSTYAVTFAQAMERGFPRVSQELTQRQLLALAGYGTLRAPIPQITRRHLVRGLPRSCVRSHVRQFRPQVGRGRRCPSEEAAHGSADAS
jgi:hypothetical protein